MSVRIVKGDFWHNFRTHEILIKRCFMYLFSKYPNPEGYGDAYHHLMIQMAHLNVFSKFNARRGKKGNGKTSDKKFEQFIYKWCEQIMNQANLVRMKRAARFCQTDKLGNICAANYRSVGLTDNPDLFDEDEEQSRKSKKYRRKVKVHFVSSTPQRCPDFHDIGDFHSCAHENPENDAAEAELYEKVAECLKDENERKIFEQRTQGLPTTVIAENLDCSPQAICFVLNRIRDRCEKRQILPKKETKNRELAHA